MFFTFLKLYKWYQIVQSVSYRKWIGLWEINYVKKNVVQINMVGSHPKGINISLLKKKDLQKLEALKFEGGASTPVKVGF